MSMIRRSGSFLLVAVLVLQPAAAWSRSRIEARPPTADRPDVRAASAPADSQAVFVPRVATSLALSNAARGELPPLTIATTALPLALAPTGHGWLPPNALARSRGTAPSLVALHCLLTI